MNACIHCKSKRLKHQRIPDHRREWKDEVSGEEFVEYMPSADDYECVDCERIWTIFDGETP